MSINRVVISGNLTRDPELREIPNGMSVLRFRVAVNDSRRNQQTGEWEDYTNYVDCTMFGKRATAVSKFISKGSKVAIEGKLRYSSWEKDGNKRSKLDVNVNEIEFMSRNNGGDDGYNNAGGNGYSSANSYSSQSSSSGYNNANTYSSQSSEQYNQAQTDTGVSDQFGTNQYSPTPEVDTSDPAYNAEIPF